VAELPSGFGEEREDQEKPPPEGHPQKEVEKERQVEFDRIGK
jgi:hypothetical protein